jgi:hypothetical protein
MLCLRQIALTIFYVACGKCKPIASVNFTSLQLMCCEFDKNLLSEGKSPFA